jgi:hypothetical protein
MRPKIGDYVKWFSSRKPLGTIVHMFTYDGYLYAVIKRNTEYGRLEVVKVTDNLMTIPHPSTKEPNNG